MIWLIILMGSILRLIGLNQSLWLDEAINVLATKNFSLIGMITDYARFDFHPPGYFFILWTWAKLFGTSEIAVRVPSAVFGLITIYLVFLIGQKIYSRNLGLLAAFLLAINPLHIYYSQEARMYSLAAMAVIINIYLVIKLIKEEKVGWVYLIGSNFLILMSDYVAYLIFPAIFVFLLLTRKLLTLKRWFYSLIIPCLLGVWWLPIFLSQLNIGSTTANNLPIWKMIVGGFDLKTVPLTLVKFIIGRISYPDKLIYYSALIPVCLLFIWLLLRGYKKAMTFYKNLLSSWLVVPIILASLISLVIPIYEYFRLLYILPAFIILVALGIFSYQRNLRNTFFVVITAVEIFSSLIYLFNPSYQRENWKGLVNFLNIQNQSVVLFESSGTFPPFDYYAKNRIKAYGALKTFPARNSNEIEDLNAMINGSSNVFLVDYLVQISDPNRLVAQNLNELGYKIKETRDFNGLGFVYHYVR